MICHVSRSKVCESVRSSHLTRRACRRKPSFSLEMIVRWMLPLCVVFGLVQGIGGHEYGVITLNEDNFEHATQAASGQTTGFW